MPDSSCSPQVAVSSEMMSTKQSQSKGSSNQCAGGVQIDLGEVTQHNIKVLKKVNQVSIWCKFSDKDLKMCHNSLP